MLLPLNFKIHQIAETFRSHELSDIQIFCYIWILMIIYMFSFLYKWEIWLVILTKVSYFWYCFNSVDTVCLEIFPYLAVFMIHFKYSLKFYFGATANRFESLHTGTKHCAAEIHLYNHFVQSDWFTVGWCNTLICIWETVLSPLTR